MTYGINSDESNPAIHRAFLSPVRLLRFTMITTSCMNKFSSSESKNQVYGNMNNQIEKDSIVVYWR